MTDDAFGDGSLRGLKTSRGAAEQAEYIPTRLELDDRPQLALCVLESHRHTERDPLEREFRVRRKSRLELSLETFHLQTPATKPSASLPMSPQLPPRSPSGASYVLTFLPLHSVQ